MTSIIMYLNKASHYLTMPLSTCEIISDSVLSGRISETEVQFANKDMCILQRIMCRVKTFFLCKSW